MRYVLDIENSLKFKMHPSYLEWEVVKKQILIQLESEILHIFYVLR